MEAEWDAQTLAEANIIKADPARLASAEVAAQKLAEKKKEEAKAMSKVAKKEEAKAMSKVAKKKEVRMSGNANLNSSYYRR